MSAAIVNGSVPELVPMDRFENAIREIGVVAACEWFGHASDSEFTKETVAVLQCKTAMQPSAPSLNVSDIRKLQSAVEIAVSVGYMTDEQGSVLSEKLVTATHAKAGADHA